MSDRFTVTTHESWFSRMGSAFKGILVGILLLIAGVTLLWWNEGRAVLTAEGLTEGAGLVISVPADSIDPANEGKLVHTSGEALTSDELIDPNFSYMRVKALLLRRSVEMYQWRENKQSKEVTEVGGGKKTETTYSYDKVWSSTLNSSSNFYERSGHENPSAMPYGALTLTARDAKLGAFHLPQGMLGGLDAAQPLGAPDSAPVSGKQKIVNGQIYMGDNPDTPAVGDIRISYAYAPEQEITVVAGQRGGSFTAFPVKNGQRNIQMLRPGLHDAAYMFNAALEENSMLTWLLRAGGLIALFIGFNLFLRPLAVFGDVLPLLGSVLSAGIGIIALCLALFCGLLVIGAAWFFYRPLLGGLLLFGAVAVLLGIRRLAKRAKTAQPAGGA